MFVAAAYHREPVAGRCSAEFGGSVIGEARVSAAKKESPSSQNDVKHA
jgi:hypothetical protein